MSSRQLLFALLAVALLVAVVTDLRSRRIPDLLTYSLMGVSLAVRAGMDGLGAWDQGLLSGLIAMGLALGWFSLFALREGGLGWGDVKLAGGVGAALGLPLVVAAVIGISLAGALQAVVSLIWQADSSATVRQPKKHIPYGVAIALGSLGAMWWDGNAF
ncbi:MAG: prepilin peptidase [Myxococcota bacterium]